MKLQTYILLFLTGLIFLNPASAATITAGVTNPDFANHVYSVELIDPVGEARIGYFIINNATNPRVFNYTLDMAGMWTVDIYEYDLSLNYLRTVTSSVISIVTPEGASVVSFSSDIANTNPINTAKQKETIYLNTVVTNLDLVNNNYPVKITDSAGVLIENLPVITSPQQFTIYLDPAAYSLTGNYLATLYQYNYATGIYTVLKSTTLTVTLPANSSTAGYMIFNKSQYYLGDQMNIYFALVNPDFGTYSYYMALYDGSGFLEDTQPIYSGQITGNWEPNHVKTTIQNFNAKLIQKKLYDYSLTLLDEVSVSYGNVVTTPTGNVSTPLSAYNQGDTIPISYNISVNGRLRIGRSGAYANYNVLAGTNQLKNYYVPSSATLGAWTIQLQYSTDAVNWYTLATKSITITGASGGTSALQFDLPSYLQGNTMQLVGFLSTAYPSGTVTLTDSNGNVKLNTGITNGSSQIFEYNIIYTDPVGTWTATLKNDTGVTLVTTTATVYVSAPTVTITITGTPSPGATIDYVGDPTARKAQENSFLNSAYGVMTGLFGMAVLATMFFFLKKMRF